MATGADFDTVEIGRKRATYMEPCDTLEAGEVGYLTASIKTVDEARVGDTVTLAENPADAPLEGYRKVNPVVFCGIYPADGAKYPDLREALEKLSLNDASLLFEPESSKALGFGFRAAFWGFCIWKSSRNGSNASIISILLPPRRALSINSCLQTVRP